MFARMTLLSLALLLPSPALAQTPPAPGKSRVVRRVQRHDRDRSLALARRERVVRIDTVVVHGRPQRPQAALELSIGAFEFPVGTARYSPADRRHAQRGRGERW